MNHPRRWRSAFAIAALVAIGDVGLLDSGPEYAPVGLVNATKVAIAAIHFSHPNQPHRWGANVLVGDPIPAGEWRVLEFPCHVRDMQFVDVHGRECILEEIYPCLGYPYDPPPDEQVPGASSTMRVGYAWTLGCAPFGQAPIDDPGRRPRRLPRRD